MSRYDSRLAEFATDAERKAYAAGYEEALHADDPIQCEECGAAGGMRDEALEQGWRFDVDDDVYLCPGCAPVGQGDEA